MAGLRDRVTNAQDDPLRSPIGQPQAPTRLRSETVQPQAVDREVLRGGSSFTRGLRSGTTRAGAAFDSLNARIAETVGDDEKAALLREKSAEAQELADRQAPRIRKVEDIRFRDGEGGLDIKRGLRDVGSFTAGLAGSSIAQTPPAIVGGIGGALVAGPPGAVAGAAAGLAPGFIGESIQSTEEDPVASEKSLLERNVADIVTGSAQAALAVAAPAVTGSKFVAKKGGDILLDQVQETTGRIIAKNVAGTAFVEGATELGETELELLKLDILNPDRDRTGDESQRLNAVVGGFLLGASFGPIGAVGDLRARGSTTSGPGSSEGADAGAEGGDIPPRPNPFTGLRDRINAARDLDGAPTIDQFEAATTPEQQQEVLRRFERAQENTSARQVDAGLSILEQVKTRIAKARRLNAETPHVSATISALFPTLNEANPGVFKQDGTVRDQRILERTAVNILGLVDEARRTGQLSDSKILAAQSILGDNFISALRKVDLVAPSDTPGGRSNLSKVLLRAAKVQKNAGSIEKLLIENAVDQDFVNGLTRAEVSFVANELAKTVGELRGLAASETDAQGKPLNAKDQKEVFDSLVAAALEADFGENAKFIADEVAKQINKLSGESRVEAEPDAKPEEDKTNTVVVGKGSAGKPGFVGLTLDDPSTKLQLERIARRDFVRTGGAEGQTEDQFVAERLADPNFVEGRLQSAREAIAEASAERAVEISKQLREQGLDSEAVGFVIDTTADDPLTLSPDELQEVRGGIIDPETGKRKVQSKEKDTRRVEVDGNVFDATRLTKLFRKKFAGQFAQEETAGANRDLRLFKEGLAALIAQSKEGEVNVDFDGVVLDGKNTLAALAKSEKNLLAASERKTNAPIREQLALLDEKITALEAKKRTPETDSQIRILNERKNALKKGREDFKQLLIEATSDAELLKIAKTVEDTREARFKRLKESAQGRTLKRKDFVEAGIVAAEDFAALVENEIDSRKGFTQEASTKKTGVKAGPATARPPSRGFADTEQRFLETGQEEADPFGNVLQQFGRVQQLFVDNAGLPLTKPFTKQAQPLVVRLSSLRNSLMNLQGVKANTDVRPQLKVAAKILKAMRRIDSMNAVTQARLVPILRKGASIDEMNKLLDQALSSKEVKAIDPVKEFVADLRSPTRFLVDRVLDRIAVTTADGALNMVRTVEALSAVKKPSRGQSEVLRAMNDRLHELMEESPNLRATLSIPPQAHEKTDVVAGSTQPVDVAPTPKKGAAKEKQLKLRFSRERINETTGETTEAQREDVRKWLESVVPWVSVVFDKEMDFSGEFIGGNDAAKSVIKISAFAKNPSSVGFHEAAHEFFRMMADPKNMGSEGKKIIQTLQKAANSPLILNRMRKLLDGQKQALKQLENNPEERIAYMMQFHRTGQLEIGPKTTSIFAKVFNFIANIFGVWSTQKRAVHIMNFFQEGEFKQFVDTKAKVTDRNAVYNTLMKQGTNPRIDTLIGLAKPFVDAGEAIFGASTNRLRGTGIVVFDQLMDKLYRPSTASGRDRGFVQAKRVQSDNFKAKLMNPLMRFSQKEIQSAFEKHQRGISDKSTKALSKADRTIIRELNKWFKDVRTQIQGVGIDVGNRAVRSNYTPWILDISKVTKNQDAFVEMLSQEKYRDAWVKQFGDKFTPEMMMSRVIADDGNVDSSVDTIQSPSAPFIQPRQMSFIDDADMAPFLESNAFRVLTIYADQAANQIQWAKRFGGKDKNGVFNVNQKITDSIEEAKDQGATPEQLRLLNNIIDTVNGRSGSTIAPEWRALFENTTILQNLAIMPLGIFAQVGDPIIMLARGATISDAAKAYIRSIRDIPRIFTNKGPVNDEAYKLAEDMNTITNISLVQAISRTGAGMSGFNSANPLLRKANDWLFRANLMEQFTISMRVAATEAAVSFITRHASLGADANKRFLSELGLQQSDVILAGVKRNRPLLTSEDFMLHAGMDRVNAEIASRKMIGAVNAFVETAVIRPSPGNLPVWSSDPRFLLFSHLKKFVLAFNEVTLKRIGREIDAGNYVPAVSMISIVPVMMAGDILKEMLLNEGNPKDRDVWDRVVRAWQRGGLFGNWQYADDFVDQIRRGNSGVDVLGPAFETVTDLIRAAFGPQEFTTAVANQLPFQQLTGSRSFEGIIR